MISGLFCTIKISFDKDVADTIQKAVDASPELKQQEAAHWNVYRGWCEREGWRDYENDLSRFIADENAFRDGEIWTTGTDIDRMVPLVGRFGGGNRAEKKHTIVDKPSALFEKCVGVGSGKFNKKGNIWVNGGCDSVDKALWKEVEEDYRKARDAFYPPRHARSHRRDDDEGMYRLYKAYHAASASGEKDNLVYARILVLMAHEACLRKDEWLRLNRFIEPAWQAYQRAMNEEGKCISQTELADIARERDELNYILQCEDYESGEQSYAMVEGLSDIADFSIHDSRPICFEHTLEDAHLTLQYNDVVVWLAFENPFDIYVEGDPTARWIQEFIVIATSASPNALFLMSNTTVLSASAWRYSPFHAFLHCNEAMSTHMALYV